MRRSSWVALAAVVSLLGVSETASATVTKNFFNYCTTGGVKTCASVQVQTTALLGGGTQVVMRVRNLQGTDATDNTGGSVLTMVGLTSPSLTGAANFGTTLDGAVQQHNDPASHWSISGQPIGGTVTFSAGTSPGHRGGILGCADAGNGQSFFRTCDSSGHTGWVVFSFTTTNAWTANDAQMAFKVQAVNLDGGSYECRSEATVGQPHHCEPDGPPPDQVVPEPISMALLGTGLAGLGGFRAMRRRRREDGIDVDDTEDDG